MAEPRAAPPRPGTPGGWIPVGGVPPAHPSPARPAEWGLAYYKVEQRRFTLGRQYRILDATGNLVAYAKQRWFRIKEAFTVYTGEDQRQVSFTVQATKVFDFNANLEVRDAAGTLLGTLRRKGWASVLSDHWQVVGPDGALVGELFEDRGRGLMRRMLTRLIPYEAEVRNAAGAIASVRGRFQVWGDVYDVHIHHSLVDGRVLVGLLVVVDAWQEERGSILPNLAGGT